MEVSGVIHLRKLTLKSKLGFGNLKDLTVNEILQRNKHRELLNIYYTLSNIDFDDDVKMELCLSPIRQIYKKGKIGKDEARFLTDECLEEIGITNQGIPLGRIKDDRALMNGYKKRKQIQRKMNECSKIKNRDRNQKHL